MLDLSSLLFTILPFCIQLVVGFHQLQLDVVVEGVERVHHPAGPGVQGPGPHDPGVIMGADRQVP